MLRRAVRSRMHKHRRSPAHNRQQRMQRRTDAATVCSMNVVAVHATVNAGAILHTASAAHRRRFHQMPRWCAESQNTDSTDFVRSWICLCVRHWFQQPNSSACLGVALRCGALRSDGEESAHLSGMLCAVPHSNPAGYSGLQHFGRQSRGTSRGAWAAMRHGAQSAACCGAR